jgi:hypothetical protein
MTTFSLTSIAVPSHRAGWVRAIPSKMSWASRVTPRPRLASRVLRWVTVVWVRAWREGMSRGWVCGRLGLRLGLGVVLVWGLVEEGELEAEVEVLGAGSERIVKDARRAIGRRVKVFVGVEPRADVVELDAVGVVEMVELVEEGAGGMERTMRLVIGSAV